MRIAKETSYNEKELQIVFEQYRLYVEMADRVSQRRMGANTFFISVNTLLFMSASFLIEATFSREILDAGEKKKKYWPIAHVGKVVPNIFLLVHAFLLSTK